MSHDDGLRHLAMARHYRDLGVEETGGWGRFFYEGIFTTYDIDPWFLADYSLIPLSILPDHIALKLFTLIAIALTGWAMLLHCRALRLTSTSACLFLLLFFLGNAWFSARLLLARPYSIVVALTLFVLFALFTRRPILLGLLLMISVLYSQLFVFPLSFALAWIAWDALSRKLSRSLLCATCLGTLAGLALHPQTVDYVLYILRVFVHIPFLKSIGLGSEMYTGIHDIVTFFSVGLAVWMYAALLKRKTRLDDATHFLIVIVLIATGMFLVWLRMIDILWPLVTLLIARLYATDPHVLIRLRALLLPGNLPKHFTLAVIIPLLLLMSVRMTENVYGLAKRNAGNGIEEVRAAFQSIPPGSRVLNIEWQYLPQYVAARPDLLYATGIDAGFTYLANPRLSELVSMPWSPAFRKYSDAIHARGWIRELLRETDGDFLVVNEKRIGDFEESLRSAADLPLVSSSSGFLVFDLRQLSEMEL